MGEHYTEREILSRLKKVEDELILKNIQSLNLQHLLTKRLEETEKYHRDELKQKDLAINNLKSEIQRLTGGTPDTMQEPSNDAGEPSNLNTTNTWVNSIPEKAHHDLLLIGDSVIKHVRGDVINPGKDTTIACHPGARSDKIATEFRKLVKNNTYDKIIVHCGTNFIPQHSPPYTCDKITELLEIVKSLAPKSKIAFSGLLPKIGPEYLPGINKINHTIFRASTNKFSSFKFIQHRNYIVDKNGAIDRTIFCGDGIHLSRTGVGALERSYFDFVNK